MILFLSSTQPEIWLFRLNSGEWLGDYDAEDEAMVAADQARIEIARDIRVATIEGERSFVEAVAVATHRTAVMGQDRSWL
ncbi:MULTISPECIES: hypothetical protein [Mesorhizobium]|uniref:hypothetical protein n=1 Tax=Mesorhizobium TaxID=68287 RepID=UPI001012778B|nr:MULTISPECIES: hypothetical protein [Mesorhizobium]